MAETTHRMVSRRARPGRVALLVPNGGPGWQTVFKHALASLSATWGGVGDILVPTDENGQPHPGFRRIIRAFDPDYVGAYRAFHQELIRADPTYYPRWREEQDDRDSVTEDMLIDRYEKQVSGILTEWDARGAVDEVSSWAAPYAQSMGYFPAGRAGQPVEYPLVPLAKFTTQMRQALDLDLSVADSTLELMIRLRLGSLDGVKLEGGAEVRSLVAQPGDLPALRELAVLGRVVNAPKGTSPIRHIEELQSLEVPLTQNVDARSPFRRTKYGMEWITFPGMRNEYVVVLGDSPTDFCLAMACDRMRPGATWLPSKIVTGNAFLLQIHDMRHRMPMWHQPGLRFLFTSLSLGPDELHDAWLAAVRQTEDEARSWSYVAEPDLVDHWRPKRLTDVATLADGESSVCYVDDDGSLDVAMAMPTPIPNVAREAVSPADIRWEIDLDIAHAAVPNRQSIGSDLLLQSEAERNQVDIRAGLLGPTYHSMERMGFVHNSWSMEQVVTRPSVRVPGARPVLNALARSAGLELFPSQTGRLNQLIVDTWGGLEPLAQDLTGPVWGLFEKLFYEATEKPDRNGPDKSNHRIWVNGVTYVTAMDAKALMGLEEDAVRVELDRLVRIGAIRRGLLLQCERCNWLEWYSLDDVGQHFKCFRCSHSNLIEQPRWNKPLFEPNWFYDLDHAIREGLRQHGRIPLLALDRMRRQARRAFTYTLDFEVGGPDSYKAGHRPELDFAAVLDGTLIIGEAKKPSNLGGGAETEGKLKRTVAVARQLTVDTICFATGAPKWSNETKTAVEAALTGDLIVPLYYEGLGQSESKDDFSITAGSS